MPGTGASVNNIARYNVSVNDGKYDGAPMIRMGTGKYGSLGIQIYNNSMYWENNGGYTMALTPDSAWEGTSIKDVTVFNNIFYGPAKANSMSSKVSYANNWYIVMMEVHRMYTKQMQMMKMQFMQIRNL